MPHDLGQRELPLRPFLRFVRRPPEATPDVIQIDASHDISHVSPVVYLHLFTTSNETARTDEYSSDSVISISSDENECMDIAGLDAHTIFWTWTPSQARYRTFVKHV